MSQHSSASKELDQYAANIARQAQRILNGSPNRATLAVRLAIEQGHHMAARATAKATGTLAPSWPLPQVSAPPWRLSERARTRCAQSEAPARPSSASPK